MRFSASCLCLLALTVIALASFRLAHSQDIDGVQTIDPSQVDFTLDTSKLNDPLEDDELPELKNASKDGEEPKNAPEIALDGLSAEEMKKMLDSAEAFQFQAEVSRMMKLIINSLYRNKEIFLRELISNASDALDKIRLLSLTDPNALKATEEMSIRIMADKANRMLHITDTGVGMTKKDLVNNLGTIAKSGTADFLAKMGESKDMKQMNDLIGQFGVGFYSAFLVADKVIVTSKNNDDEIQHIWESDSASFTISDDPRGVTLGRGTTISLVMKEEASDYLEQDTLKDLIKKYSQFINFKIYLWSTKTETVEEPIPEEEAKDKKTDDDDEVKIEDVKDDEKKPKTKKVEKTTSDWELINTSKPIWTRKPADITKEEYDAFYKAISKDTSEPMTMTHFVAEGEVTFKSILFVPKVNPSDALNRYGTRTDNIKLFVRRVFITDDFSDIMPNYLNFIRGLVDSDDLPLNVSRETLQQHKLLKIIRKKLVRKVLEMLKKLREDEYGAFWKEYSTNLKLGVLEDTSNRGRLAKLLRFHSSSMNNGEMTSLSDYVKRMKPDQKAIFYMAGTSVNEVKNSPFVERLRKKGFEVLYMVDAVDEYCISAIPDFDGKKFQNVAKDGLDITEGEKGKERMKELEKEMEPLKLWLQEELLKDKVAKVVVSQRLHESPCALVASQFGWTGNMERLARSNAHSKSEDSMRDYYLKQKKNFEINPRHPLIQELLRRINDDKNDETAKDMGLLMFETATLRSGYHLGDSAGYAQRVEHLLRKTLGVDENAQIEDDDDLDSAVPLTENKLDDSIDASPTHDEF